MKRSLWCVSSLILLGWGITTSIPNRSLTALAQTQPPPSEITPTPPIPSPTSTPQAVPPTPSQTTGTSSETKNLATHLVLKLKEKKVYVYKDSQVLKSYPVAIGKKGWETPAGRFKVIQLVKNPVWQNPWNGKISPPGPNSPLGERWIGFWTNGKNYIGFHGTPGEHLIGQAVSHGCVRMRNKDIKELYEFVAMGLPVTVQ